MLKYFVLVFLFGVLDKGPWFICLVSLFAIKNEASPPCMELRQAHRVSKVAASSTPVYYLVHVLGEARICKTFDERPQPCDLANHHK